MKTPRIAIVAAILLCTFAGAALAGGRAHVSFVSVPKQVVVGQKFEVAFAVKPEWPMAKNRSLEPTVRARCGDREITLAATPLKASGQYKAAFTVPAAGEWVITVDSRFCETRMTPLVLKAETPQSTHS